MACSPACDPQQYEVYRWEDSFTEWARAKFSKREVTRTVVTACKFYRVPIPELLFATKNRRAGKPLESHAEDYDRILLRPRHYDLPAALHEVAHVVLSYVERNNKKKFPDHGKEFVGILMVLYERFKISPRVAMIASARTAGIKFLHYEKVHPKNVRASLQERRGR